MRRILLILFLVMLVLVACGGDDDNDRRPASPTALQLPTTTANPQSTNPVGSAIGTAVANQTTTPLPTLLAFGPTSTRFPGFPTLAVAATLPAQYPDRAQIVSPTLNTVLQGSVTVFGSASHPQFLQYTLEYGPDPNPSNLWYPITPQAVTQPVLDGVLGGWDTTSVPDGTYQIRLHLYLTTGIELTGTVVRGLQVRNQQATQVAEAINTPPSISPIASINLETGRTTTIALGIFDPNGDPVQFTATSDNLNIATVTPSGQAITLTGVSEGIATIRVNVQDSRGGTAQTSFLVVVKPAASINQAPRIDPVPSQVITAGSTVRIPLTISDPEGDSINFEVTSTAITIVQTTADVAGRAVDVTGVAAGTTTVSVRVTDAKGATTSAVFAIVVNPPVAANNRPSIAAIASQSLAVGESRTLNLSIADPDTSDTVSYTIRVENTSVVNVERLSQTEIRVTGLAAGQSQVTLTAQDNRGAQATAVFTVVVVETLPPNQDPIIEAVPDQTIEVGEEITVDLNIVDPDVAVGDQEPAFSPSSNDLSVVTTGIVDENTLRILGREEGTATVTIVVGDGEGGSTSTDFTVEVLPAAVDNRPPAIAPTFDQALEVGKSIAVPLSISDPDNTTFVIDTSSSNPAVAVVYTSNTSEITLVGLAIGESILTVTVDDGQNTTSTTFRVLVQPANRLPSLAPIPSQQCEVNTTLSIMLVYEDLDGDEVNIETESDLPETAQVTTDDGSMLQVACFAIGTARITVRASDSRGGVAQSAFLVDVGQPNRAPTIDPIGGLRLEINELATLTINYTDPDGDTALDVDVTAADSNVAEVTVLGLTQIQVRGITAGQTSVIVTVQDAQAATGSTTFLVTVVATNEFPSLEPIAPVSLGLSDNLDIPINYTDPDGDTITISAESDNLGVVTVEQTGPYTLTLYSVGEGTATITVTANDNREGIATVAFGVTVVRDNQIPVLAPIEGILVGVGTRKTITYEASDPDGDILLVTLTSDQPDIATANITSESEITVVGERIGNAAITVRLDDQRGGVVSVTFTVAVIELNAAPNLAPIDPVTFGINDTQTINFNATDSDGDVLTASLAAAPEGIVMAQFVPDTNEITLEGLAVGVATVTLTVIDPSGESAAVDFTVEVTDTNQPPTIAAIDAIELVLGESVTIPYRADDPDGDELALEISVAPEGVVSAQLIPDTNEIILEGLAVGIATVALNISDPSGEIAIAVFSAEVLDDNQLPVIDPIAPVSLTAGQSTTVAFNATDPNGDPLSPSLAVAPEGVVLAQIDADGTIALTGMAAGSATVTLTVTDPSGETATAAFTVDVVQANQPPAIDPIAPVSLTAGQSTTVAFNATDPNGDPLSSSLAVAPEGVVLAQIDADGTIALTGMAAGSATVTLTVTDPSGETATAAFTVDVVQANQPPVIDPIAPVSLTAGQSTTVAFNATDPNGDPLSPSLAVAPEGVVSAQIDVDGTIALTGMAAGSATVTLTVTDPSGETATAAFTVDVVQANQPPVIDPIAPVSLTAGQSTTVAFNATDPNGDPLSSSLAVAPEGVVLAQIDVDGTIALTGMAAGSATVTLTVTDPSGETATAAFTVDVVQANQPPVIDPIAPVELMSGNSTIIGLVINDPNGDALVISAQVDNTAIASATVVSNTELQVTGIGIGTATVTVTVDDQRGGTNFAAFTVTVSETPPPIPTFDINMLPEIPNLEDIEPELSPIYTNGINNRGLNSSTFSVVGNLPFTPDLFTAIAQGTYNLADYGQLQATINQFNFGYTSAAVDENWTINDLLTAGNGGPNCDPAETPLACELRLNQPMVVFISFSPSNVVQVGQDAFAQQLDTVIDIVLSNSSIPVVLLLPDDSSVDAETLSAYNQVIVEAATAPINYPNVTVPLWNLYRTVIGATQGIDSTSPAGPTDFSNDSLTYGNNIKGLAFLRLLEQFREVFIAP